MPSSVIVHGARTPIGRFMGSLSSLESTDLGAAAIQGALIRAGVGLDEVDYVIMGQVVQAGAGSLWRTSPAPASSSSVSGQVRVPGRRRGWLGR